MIEGLPKRIHCLGAGGAGMLPLTLFLAESGHEMSAEDDAFTEETTALLAARGVVLQGHAQDESVGIVYSSAIGESHPARAYARSKGVVALRRGECLAVIAREKKLIAVAGSHGKTTTCGMLIDILDTLGLRFDFLLGAQFDDELPYRVSGGDWLVAEIDESDGTIDLFSPEISVIVNVDHDHHSRYATEADYFAVFDRLIKRTRASVILDASVAGRFEAAFPVSGAELVAFGSGGQCSLKAVEAGPGWSALDLEGCVSKRGLLINRSGGINQIDAGFALLAAQRAGGELRDGQLFEFRPVRRRQRCWYNSPRVQVFEDYAHHPREIDSVLERFGSREGWQQVVVFQPHRYSRTRELKAEFARSLSACQHLVLLEVYAASEEPLPGGAGEDLYALCRERGAAAQFVSSEGELSEYFDAKLALGPTRVLFLGAGRGDQLARSLSERARSFDRRWGEVYAALASVSGFETRILADEPLAPKTTLRVGGAAERYFEPETLPQLVAALKACRCSGIEVRPLGRGSNVVVADEGVSGLVIRLNHPYWSRFERLPDGSARVGAGMRIKALCGQAARDGMEGFEFLEGLPGRLGGVLRMNAGAMGGWISDLVESVRYVSLDGEVLEARKADLEFGYRYCRELESAVAIDAVLRSGKPPSTQEKIKRTIDTYQSRRRETQPREPSAGCIFKNPEGDSAGRLIDELGLKGTVVGGAEISQTHGNFIINRGGATSADVVALVKLARKAARERKGVDLHPEALFFGSSWEEALR